MFHSSALHVRTTPEKFEKASIDVRRILKGHHLGLPSTVIRHHDNGVFRKRSSNYRNLKMPALRLCLDEKHFEWNGALRKR